MRTTYSPRCLRRTTTPATRDAAAGARLLVLDPKRHGADERTRGIVATLLIRLEEGR